MRCILLAAGLALGACAQFPEIDAANASGAPAGAPPPLLSFADLQAATTEPAAPTTETDALEARAAALRARAAILRRSADDIDALRARLAAAS
ncbi:MAG: hypothetical protein AAF761_02515 [Pseudomonadota bacterium]